MNDMPDFYLGVDASSTGAAAVVLDARGDIEYGNIWQASRQDDAFERMFAIRRWTEDVAEIWRDQYVSYSIEAPFFRGSSSALLAHVQGAIFVTFGPQAWGSHSPAAVKATAYQATGIKTAGKGLSKTAMSKAFAARWPDSLDWAAAKAGNYHDTTKAIGDLIDAAWVAETDRLSVAQTGEVA